MNTFQLLNFNKLFLNNSRRDHRPAKYLFGVILAAILILLSPSLLNGVEARKSAPFELSTQFDPALDLICIEIVRKSMLICWDMTSNGRRETEFGFSVIKKGSDHSIVFSQSRNLYRSTLIPIPNGTVAVFHVHPNSASPKPSKEDILLAREIKIPICTITYQGIYCYYPDRNETMKLRKNLDWAKPCNVS
jgi:hypothetical protein